jgi:hypothetical protein
MGLWRSASIESHIGDILLAVHHPLPGSTVFGVPSFDWVLGFSKLLASEASGAKAAPADYLVDSHSSHTGGPKAHWQTFDVCPRFSGENKYGS